MFDITPIVQAVIALLATIITAVVVPYVKSKTTVSQQKEIDIWIAIAVMSAEQIYSGTGKGSEKKEYVLHWLEEHNVIVDEDKIDAMIEAAVYQMKNGVITTAGWE